MRVGDLPYEDILRVKASGKLRTVLELTHIAELKKLDTFECTIFFYPYGEGMTSKDYSLLPFEEYVRDVEDQHQSAYGKIKESSKEAFGIFLGVVVFLTVLLFSHSDVITMESLVGIFAAYFIGKDLWDDIEQLLSNITSSTRFKYRMSEYQYRLDTNSTLLAFHQFAAKARRRRETIFPSEMNVIARSHSTLARMKFTPEDLEEVKENTSSLLTIELDPKKIRGLRKGYLLGAKVTFSKRFWFVRTSVDLYQSVDNGRIGCLDDDGKLLADTSFMRQHLSIGKLRYTIRTGYFPSRIFSLDT